MTFGTFCSGIGAPEVAWHRLGWQSAFMSEIDLFAHAVERYRFPGVENLGDMEAIDGEALDRVDVVCAGTPCQSFSVEGLRKGMADPRGNLALVFLRLVDQLRPAWVVWENVPGVLSSSDGRDFGSFVGGLAELGYGVYWRILDAQYVGVPQRRRRPFVVGHLGDWRRAAAVLLERHSLSGNPPPSREAGAGVASSLTRGFGSGGADDNRAQANWLIPANNFGEQETSTCLSAKNERLDGDTETFVVHSLRADGFEASEDGTGRGTPLVPICFDPGQSAAKKETVCAVVDGSPPLIRERPPAVAFQERTREGGRNLEAQADLAYSLNAPSGGGRRQEMNVATGVAVRRLTPRECERLQGFPDDWTLVPYRGKPAADGPRYRAIGNSMAVPVMEWIGKRIQMVEEIGGHGG